jgi:23S rRNA (cytidine1920-2'-O)/16S rRNA (cytidine1409-2'-O)-methyltransferase
MDLQRARSLILSGSVFIEEQKVTKIGLKFPSDCKIRIKDVISEYASRGASKLYPILKKYSINIKDLFCIDIGASTGGFTDVLLREGAESVLAIDVGYGQLIERLRNDSRVRVLDRFHAKDLNWETISRDNLTKMVIVIDVSFISILAIYSVLLQLKHQREKVNIQIISLIKPQFECNPSKLEKGILKDKNERFKVIKKVMKYIKKNKGKILGLSLSPIKGKEGNVEYFIYWEI